MSEYKCIKVVNKELSQEDFANAYNSLCKLEVGLLSNDNNVILFSGKSEKSKQFSVDVGCITTELNAFINAVNHYLGGYRNGVTIEISN